MKLRHVLVLLVLSAPRHSRADGRAPTCSEQQTSVGRVACELARSLPAPTTPLHVTVSGISSPLRMERTAELSARLARAVARELGANARVETFDANQKAPVHAPRTDALVLQGELTRERFTVNAELVRATTKFWDRFRPGSSDAVQRAHAMSALDAELASFLPPVPLVLTRIDKARLDEPSVAVACGDVEGNGGFEIVSVGRRRIQVGRVANARFEVLRSRNWSDLSEVAPRPLKEPLASVSVDGARRIRVGLSDRKDALLLDEQLAAIARYEGLFPWPAAGCVQLIATGLSETRVRCDAKAARSSGGPLDALAGARLVRRDGNSFDVLASRRPTAQLSLELGKTRIDVDAAGAQVALADLDNDGNVELITSLDTLDPSSDALVVRTVSAEGKLREAFRVKVPNGVRALGVCPSYGNLLAPLLVATADELWVLR
jgi:hypothetical protein